jgi:pyruvate formate lyase activating enzyme
MAGALSLPTEEADPSAIFDMLLPQLDVIKDCGGLTISGGEALLQQEAVLELLQLCEQHQIHTAIETSLTLPWDIYASVQDYVDCWLIGMRDLSLQGSLQQADVVLQNVQGLSASGKDVIVRLPLIRGYTDSPDQIQRMVHFMRIGHFADIELLPCNRDLEHYYVLSGITPIPSVEGLLPSSQEIETIAGFFHRAGFKVRVIT